MFLYLKNEKQSVLLASRLGLSFRSVVKVKLGSRIRQCPQQKFSFSCILKLELTEQCCVADIDFFMPAMFLIKS